MMRLPDPRDDVLRNDGIEKRKSAGETPGGFAAGGRARAVPLFRGKDGLFGETPPATFTVKTRRDRL